MVVQGSVSTKQQLWPNKYYKRKKKYKVEKSKVLLVNDWTFSSPLSGTRQGYPFYICPPILIICIYVYVYAHDYRIPQRSEEGVGSPEAEVIGVCKLPITWLLGAIRWSSARAVSTLNWWAISPPSHFPLLLQHCTDGLNWFKKEKCR